MIVAAGQNVANSCQGRRPTLCKPYDQDSERETVEFLLRGCNGRRETAIPNSEFAKWREQYQAKGKVRPVRMSVRRRPSLLRPLREAGRYFFPNWLSRPPASISIGGRSFVSAR